MEIGKYCRENLPVLLRVLRGNRNTVEQYLPAARVIKPGQKHRQGRLSAAVAANQEHQFATGNGQVQRPDTKTGMIFFAFIAEHQIAQFERLPASRHHRRRKVLLVLRQFQGFQFAKGHLCAEQRRQRAHGLQHRRAQEQQRQGIGCGDIGIRPAQRVCHKEDQPDRPQHHDIRPVHGAQVKGIGTDNVEAVLLGIFAVNIVKQMPRPFAVKRQLFAPFDDFLIVSLQFVFRFTHFRQMAVNVRHQYETTDNGDHQPDNRHQKHFR